MTDREQRAERRAQQEISSEQIVESVTELAPPDDPVPASCSMADVMALLQISRDEQRRARTAQEAAAAEQTAHMRALEERVVHLQQQLASRPAAGVSLEQMVDVHSFPMGVCDSGFSVRALQALPTEISDIGVPLLDVRGHELVLTAASKARARSAGGDKKDGVAVALSFELPPLLTIESVGHMLTAVLDQMRAENRAGTLSQDTLDAVLEGSLAFLPRWLQQVIAARRGEIAHLLLYDAKVAASYAEQAYGPQNLITGNDTATRAIRQQQSAAKAAVAAKSEHGPAQHKPKYQAAGHRRDVSPVKAAPIKGAAKQS